MGAGAAAPGCAGVCENGDGGRAVVVAGVGRGAVGVVKGTGVMVCGVVPDGLVGWIGLEV